MIRLFSSLIGNLATLLTAFILALVIWGAAIRENDPSSFQQVQVAVEIIGQPPNSIILNRGQDMIQVLIEGRDSALAELTSADFGAVIDLSDVPYGQAEVDIQVLFENDSVRVVSQFPERTIVHMEQIITREIPLRVVLRGDVARGHERGEPLLEPSSIFVTGPSSRVEPLAEARVTLFLNNERQDVRRTLRPTFYDFQDNPASVTGLEHSSEEVVVTLSIIELAGFTDKPISPQWEGLPASGYRLLNVTVQPQSVLLTGPPAVLERLRVLRTETIDITGLTQSFTQQVTLNLPDEVQQDQPQAIIVTVEIEPILTSSVIVKEPELRALGPELVAELDPAEVRVFLFGPLPVIDSLRSDDVRVTLDLLNLGVGVHSVAPTVDVFANNVEVRSFNPPLVTVTITREMTTTEEITRSQGLPLLPLRPLAGAAGRTSQADGLSFDMVATARAQPPRLTYRLKWGMLL